MSFYKKWFSWRPWRLGGDKKVFYNTLRQEREATMFFLRAPLCPLW